MTTAATAGKDATEPGTPDPAKAAADQAAAAAEKATADTAAADKLAAEKATADADAARKAGETQSSSKAPDTYALTVPKDSLADATDVALVETTARSLGLTNEEAQSLLESHATEMQTRSTQFLATTTADKDYGGDKLEETQRHALVALDKLRPKGTPRGDALRGLLNKTGYGNHIEVISLLADIGKQMAEDAPAHHTSGAGGDRDPADVLYGKK